MTVIVGPHKASPELLAPLSDLIARHAPMNNQVRRTEEHYVIDDVQKSESAWILFTHQEQKEDEKYVIKLLCDYNDRRYDLESPLRRQQCQIEALTCNSTFSPDVYIGLASAYQLEVPRARLTIGSPTHATTDLDQCTEYALVMRQLPVKNRLDFLLGHEDESRLQQHTSYIVQRIVDIHNARPALPLEDSRRWGGFQNLKLKLEHNLSLSDPLFENKYPAPLYTPLQKRFAYLRTNLEKIFNLYPYEDYFAQRVSEHSIKHCHGDLKGPNVWIEDDTEERRVAILDAIDFNPMYSNIDTLSDFATLVIDVQTRLHCTRFAHVLTQRMIKQYLLATNQYHNRTARSVLHYYLVEKAFVGAAISIVYDDLPELGMDFLKAAEACWHSYFTKPISMSQREAPHQQRVPALTS